jgi:hypothetical protein
MRLPISTTLLSVILPFCASALAGDTEPELALRQVLGGSPVAPTIVGTRIYLPTGRIVTAIDQKDPTVLRMTGSSSTQPATGRIVGVAQQGRHLYAAWETVRDESGVAVYSLADPDQPVLIDEITDYTPETFRDAQSIAVGNGHLYLLDTENGIFVAPLDTPERPAFSPGLQAFGSWLQVQVKGNRLYATGRNWSGQRAVEVFDIQTPLQPAPLGFATLDGLSNFTLALDAPLGYGFGFGFHIHDFSNPANMQTLSSIDDGRVSYSGFASGNHAYAIGNVDIQPWQVGDPVNPVASAPIPMDTFATDVAVPFNDGGLLVTRADRVLSIDLGDPLQPQVAGALLIKGTVDAHDIGFAGDKALILQSTYGLQVADWHTLEPESRAIMDLPPVLQARVFEQLHIEGNMAYLASWGSGLFMVDVSNPAVPRQVGHWEMAYVSSVDVVDGLALVGRVSGPGGFNVIDVSNPARPLERGGIGNVHPIQIRNHGRTAFLADTDSGVRIIDFNDPDLPRQIGSYQQDCAIALALELSRDGDTAYVLCALSGVHVLDVSNPARPLRLGVYDLGGITAVGALAVMGDRLYVGSDLGLDEVDISDSHDPQRIHRHLLPVPPFSIRIAPDNRILAMTANGGIHVFENSDIVFSHGFE